MYYRLRDAGSLYMRKIVNILLLIVFYVIPIQIAYFVFSGYFVLNDVDGFWGNMLSSALYLITFSILSIPFIQMVKEEVSEGEVRFRPLVRSVIENLFPVLWGSMIFTLIVITGLNLLIVPGIILLVMLFLFPFSYVINTKGIKKAFKNAWTIAGNHFFVILSYVGFVLVNNQLGQGVGYLVMEATEDPLSVIMIQVLYYALSQPFIFLFLSYNYLSMVEDEESKSNLAIS